MLKWATSFILNRLVFLAAVWFVVTTYTRSACHLGGAYSEGLEHAIAGWSDIARALQ